MELPPDVARNFVRDMRDFHSEKDAIKRDGDRRAPKLYLAAIPAPTREADQAASGERDVPRHEGPRMTLWIYVDTNKQVGDEDHLKVFASADAADAWFAEHDPEGVAFEYQVIVV